MYEQFVSVSPDDLEWEDGSGRLTLPAGVKIKLLNEDVADNNRVDFLVRFPPGYHEPVHHHVGLHFGIVLEGSQIVPGGKVNTPGTYVYAPAEVVHGPFDYPEGCTLFGSMAGGMAHLIKE
jgi:anti-sigma factor ChrR (cupin superfamily)